MTDLNKIKALTTEELIQHYEVSEEAQAHILPENNPQINIELLAQRGLFHDAVSLLAHGLPKREAVWWACLATRASITPETDETNMAALVAAEAWVKKPTEERRIKCRDLAQQTLFKSAPSWAATAASWSTGSLSKEGEPEVTPPEYLYAHAVAGSVSLAATGSDPEKMSDNYNLFLKQGFDLARGGNGQVGTD
ncbi:MAG: hypothetical protein KTR17_06675 [Cellvibrionaceae bacterium]|nr:hypothetical protein [Cellvibrionaceae bacterium]